MASVLILFGSKDVKHLEKKLFSTRDEKNIQPLFTNQLFG